MKPAFEVLTLGCRLPFPKREIQKFIKKLFKSSPRKKGPSDLTLVFVTPRQSQLLNKKYRSKNYPTDVLTFPEELVLCLDVLKRQARVQKHSLKREVQTMVVHGFLHLLGYDHEKSRREELKMFKLQDKLLSKLSK